MMIKTNNDLSKIKFVDRGQKDIACGDVTGLKIRVSVNRKVFYLFYKIETKPYKYKIGLFGDIGMPEAKKAAMKLKVQIKFRYQSRYGTKA